MKAHQKYDYGKIDFQIYSSMLFRFHKVQYICKHYNPLHHTQ